MTQHGKKYRQARAAIDREREYPPVEAIKMLKSFAERQLVENYAALVEEIVRAKPAAAKGRYIRQITLATTMGPGIHVDTTRTRNIAEDLEEAEAVSA